MISQLNTWDDYQQPADEAQAGRITFNHHHYEFFQKGLRILLRQLRELDQLSRKLGVRQSPYEKDINRIQTMIEWGEEKLSEIHSTYAGISDIVSYETLRYLKAGLLLLILEEYNNLRQSNFPKSLNQIQKEKIEDLKSLAEHDGFTNLRPHDTFFEISDYLESKNSKNPEFTVRQIAHKHERKQSLEALLSEGESDKLEIKGSLLVDIDRLLKGDRKKVRDKEIALKGVLKTIVGFLNTEGGRVIVGAIEKSQYPEIPDSFLALFSEFQDYYLPGIEIELDKKGVDGYLLKVRNLIEQHIARDLANIVTCSIEILNGKTLCLIEVEEVSDRWYYLNKNDFFVRDGNRTILLQGEDADKYKRRKNRG